MNKIKIFEKNIFDLLIKKKRKKIKNKNCDNCQKNIKDISLISHCHNCEKIYCFDCCNKLFFGNYFNFPDKNYDSLIYVLFHTVDRCYFNKMCCSNSYYINFIPNKFNILSYYEKNNSIYNLLKKHNLPIVMNTNDIETKYKKELKLLYNYSNELFWKTYLLIKCNIPIEIIFYILKFNINFINFRY